jgi:protein TonB
MNRRLQQKCFLASAGIHLLLLVILFVGPAFLSPRDPLANLPVIDFIPDRLVDAAVVGGGNPNVRPPPPTPAPPTPAPPPPVVKPAPAPEPEPKPEPKVREPEPVKTAKEQTPDPDSLEVQKRKKPAISTKIVTRKDTPAKTSKAGLEAGERALAQARQQIARAASSIREAAAAPTTIEDFGPGGGGPAYASYAAWVKTVYENAWVPPAETASDDAITVATVTIARDGTVVSARISKGSGDALVDASVRSTLDRVRTIGRPFPEGVKDKERTYIIHFNLKAKRGLA